MTAEASILHMIYRNHRGETRYRRVFPARLWHGSTEWHPQPQWLMHALDMDTHCVRDFALADIIYSWAGEPQESRPHIGNPLQAIDRIESELGGWALTLTTGLRRAQPVSVAIETAPPRPEDSPLEGL